MRRTLHLPVLCSAIILTCTIACKSRRERDKEFMHQQLEKLNEQVKSFQQEIEPDKYVLYDSVEKKYSETFLEQFRSTLSGGISYIANLKEQFTQYCGDSAGLVIPADQEANIDLTNKFFVNDRYGESLYSRLTAVQKTMNHHNDDPELDKEIHALTGVSDKEGAKIFASKYFKDVPPVAAMTILSRFVNEIDHLEKRILQGILKNNNVTEK